jgi:hypothetical protein
MWRRRKLAKEWQRQFDEREHEAIVAARDAVSHVVAAFMTHPDIYAPKACIIAHNPRTDSLPYVMFELAYEDSILGDYRFDGDASLIVQEVVEMPADQNLADVVVPWLAPHDAGQVAFHALPGIFQEAFAKYWTGLEIPFHETFLMWAPAYGQPDQHGNVHIVRRFPPTGAEGGPAIGELGYIGMPAELVTTLFNQRGW